MIVKTPSPFICFWDKHPALLYALLLLGATAFCLNSHPVELIAVGILLFPFAKRKDYRIKTLFFLLIFFLGLASASYRAPTYSLKEEKVEGTARFSISSLKHFQSPFHHSLAYQGTLLWFQPEKGELLNQIPCQIHLPVSANHPPAHCDYVLSGTLVQTQARQLIFKPKKNQPWTPVPSTYSLAEMRYRAKLFVHTYLKKQTKDRSVSNFLNAIVTGDIDDRTLSMEFNRVGVQHILAISGFHFALIAIFLNAILRFFFPMSFSSSVLILFLTAYYLFLGDSPSIQRAWIAMLTFLIGKIFNLRTTPLNALGVALFTEIAIEPAVISLLGFQLSFLCTFSILLLAPITQRIGTLLLPIRTFSAARSLSHLDKWGYVIGSLIRQSLAINFAVLLGCLPVLLLLFHRFPLLSLIYNLFIPFWASLSLILLLLAFFIPPLSHLLFTLNEYWTRFTLNITAHPPALLEVVLRTKSLTYPTVIIFLSLLFMGAIYLRENRGSCAT